MTSPVVGCLPLISVSLLLECVPLAHLPPPLLTLGELFVGVVSPARWSLPFVLRSVPVSVSVAAPRRTLDSDLKVRPSPGVPVYGTLRLCRTLVVNLNLHHSPT